MFPAKITKIETVKISELYYRCRAKANIIVKSKTLKMLAKTNKCDCQVWACTNTVTKVKLGLKYCFLEYKMKTSPLTLVKTKTKAKSHTEVKLK